MIAEPTLHTSHAPVRGPENAAASPAASRAASRAALGAGPDPSRPERTARADRLLRRMGVVWFAVAAIGQIGFVYFIIAYFGRRTVAGDFARWNEKPLIDGHIEGDGPGNVMFISHALLAAVITLGGLLQLIPQIRARAPWFHRWTGRVFAVIAIFMAIGGIWLAWVRGTRLSDVSAIAITLNALLILWFVGVAWRFALARKIDAHRRWAMRAFLAVNGVWFLRVGIMAWVLLNQGPRWMDRTLSGPADIGLVFGCYLIPLAMLEIYFAAQRSQTAAPKHVAAGLLAVMTLITAVGVFGTIAFMWGPYI